MGGEKVRHEPFDDGDIGKADMLDCDPPYVGERLPHLLTFASRVLRPGGLWVYYGPYSRNDGREE